MIIFCQFITYFIQIIIFNYIHSFFVYLEFNLVPIKSFNKHRPLNIFNHNFWSLLLNQLICIIRNFKYFCGHDRNLSYKNPHKLSSNGRDITLFSLFMLKLIYIPLSSYIKYINKYETRNFYLLC
jgi:hypothetical protein